MADQTYINEIRRKRNEPGEKGKSIGPEKTELGELEKEKFSVAGKGLGAKEADSSGQPKQQPGESLGSYSSRLRDWRSKKKSVSMDQAGSALGKRLER